MSTFLIRRIVFASIATIVLLVGCSDYAVFPSQDLTEPPDAVLDAALTFDPDGHSAVLAWTEPHTNGGTTRLLRYDIRYDYGDTLDWDTAREVIDPPEPGSAGRRLSYRFDAVERGRTLHASLRVIDVSGNVSDPGNIATLDVPGYRVDGHLRDALTGQGIAGLNVAYGNSQQVTGADGGFVFDELAATAATIYVSGATTPPTYFPVSEAFVVSSDTELTFLMIPYGQSSVSPGLSMLAAFKTAVGVRSSDSILKKWPSLPVDLYIPDFVNSYGVDYGAAAHAAATRWMELTGLPLFRIVDAPPSVGVDIRFRTPQDMGIQIGFTEHTNSADGAPLKSRVSVVDSFNNLAPLNRTLLHELGHTLRLSHMPAGFLMYAGLPLPDDPTPEEVWIVQLLHALPDRIDLSIYHEVGE